MSGTSNEQLPLSTGKKSTRNDIGMENETPRNNLSRATKILCSRLILLYRCYTVVLNPDDIGLRFLMILVPSN